MSKIPVNNNSAPTPRVHPSLPSGKIPLGQFQQQLTIPGMSPAEAHGQAILTQMGLPGSK